jgi:cation:H+ antiporter
MSEAAWIEISWSALALLVILGACELFTNGIEWLGRTLNLSDGAVGSVLAAVGTAMPETIVPLVAILLIGGPSGNEVAIGGILGAPFMLGTLAFFVTGVAVFLFQRRRPTRRQMVVKTEVLKWDVGAFVVAYLLAIGSSFLPHHWQRVVVAAFLVAGYVLYAWRHFRTGPGDDEEPPELRRLYLRWREREAVPHIGWSVSQSLVGLALILVGARVFVSHLTRLCTDLGADPRLLALLVVPVATELPEKFNSVIWVRQGKDTLAIGNITGAMVFQSCIPVAVGMLFTSWHLTRADLLSAAIALASSALLFTSLVLGRRLSPWVLLVGVVGYGLFLALVLR